MSEASARTTNHSRPNDGAPGACLVSPSSAGAARSAEGKPLQPDVELCQRHLARVFGAIPESHNDGLVEIAWSRGTVWGAQHFHLDRLDQAADLACNKNRSGCQVYVSPALHRPETNPGRRSKDADFYAAHVVWADFDGAGDSERYEALHTDYPSPHFAVITARHPHLRFHLYWRIGELITDGARLEDLNVRIAHALQSDKMVTNRCRLMRLAGTINWARKPGRTDERTEWIDGTAL